MHQTGKIAAEPAKFDIDFGPRKRQIDATLVLAIGRDWQSRLLPAARHGAVVASRFGLPRSVTDHLARASCLRGALPLTSSSISALALLLEKHHDSDSGPDSPFVTGCHRPSRAPSEKPVLVGAAACVSCECGLRDRARDRAQLLPQASCTVPGNEDHRPWTCSERYSGGGGVKPPFGGRFVKRVIDISQSLFHRIVLKE